MSASPPEPPAPEAESPAGEGEAGGIDVFDDLRPDGPDGGPETPPPQPPPVTKEELDPQGMADEIERLSLEIAALKSGEGQGSALFKSYTFRKWVGTGLMVVALGFVLYLLHGSFGENVNFYKNYSEIVKEMLNASVASVEQNTGPYVFGDPAYESGARMTMYKGALSSLNQIAAVNLAAHSVIVIACVWFGYTMLKIGSAFLEPTWLRSEGDRDRSSPDIKSLLELSTDSAGFVVTGSTDFIVSLVERGAEVVDALSSLKDKALQLAKPPKRD